MKSENRKGEVSDFIKRQHLPEILHDQERHFIFFICYT